MSATLLAHRYFFAALPDRASAARIRAWAERRLGSEGLLDAQRLHATLAIAPDFSTPQHTLSRALVVAGQRVAAPAFDLVLDRLSIGTRSAALRPGHSQKAALALHDEIAGAMAAQGVEMREGWRFSPHVTLAYRDGLPATQPVSDLGWTVGGFALIHSLVGLAQYEVLGRWILRPDPQFSLFG
ncbi:MAG: 2'-5' RNA ligase family protein [Novosphingobium sp.]|nr:2'-5' RNA ligase family protein [Novosphingobium sp.]MBO9603995.1 2'-5' RNA ligase family protein [Novosphingobium sp.]